MTSSGNSIAAFAASPISFALDFHHLDPASKEFDIAMAMNDEWTWEAVLAEIRKCVCLCANCHRKVHAGRFEVTEAMLCDV